jgi:hypothetical protein
MSALRVQVCGKRRCQTDCIEMLSILMDSKRWESGYGRWRLKHWIDLP